MSSITAAIRARPEMDELAHVAPTLLRAHPWLAAAIGGLGLVLVLPPVGVPLGLLGLTILVHLLHGETRPGRALLLGWLFGLAYFVGGLYWVAIAFFVDAEAYGWLAVPAVLGLSALLGLTVGLAAWVTALPRWRSLEARALAFAAACTGAELVRAGTIIQFPWNPIAIAWTTSDVTLQGVAWLGTYGLSLVTVAAAGLLARCLEPGGRRWTGLVAPAVLVAALLGGGAYRLATAGEPALTPVRLRLVQADIPQHLKWDLDQEIGWFRRHLDLSREPAAVPPDALVWPESAVAFSLEADAVGRGAIAGVLSPGAYALVGGDHVVIEDGKVASAANSLFAIDAKGEIRARHDKVNLVPFGEFTPFRPILGRLGFGKLVESTLDFTPGPGRATVSLPGLPPFSPLICYEAVFPNEAALPSPRPAWLLNITNDAWFGTSSGPYQHLAMARMRAVEEGLPLVRAANTGVSVVTDPYGRVLHRLGLGRQGVVDARLPEPLPQASPERRLGWPLLAGLIVVLLGSSFAVERLARRPA
jgi:apolipoprotein N-acyltransferase